MIDDSMIEGLSGINQESPLVPFCAFQNHSIDGYILKWSDARTGLELFRASVGGCYEVYYPHPPDNLAKYCVTRLTRRPVEPEIASLIDKKLGGGGVRIICSGHGDCSTDVVQLIDAFVFYRFPGFFLYVLGRKTAPLHHEVINDSMKDSAVIESRVNVRQKIFHCYRGFFREKFDIDNACRGVETNNEIFFARP